MTGLGLGCIAARQRLQAFHDDELPIDEQIAVGAHLETCAACHAEFAELGLLRSALRASMPGRAALATNSDASFQAAVLSRMNAEQTQSIGVRLREMFEDMHLVYAGLGAATAAAFCMAVMLGMMPFGASEGPGSNEFPVAVNPFVRMPRPIDEPFAKPFMSSIDGEYMLTGIVTREGRMDQLEVLDRSETVAAAADQKLLEDLMGAVSRARFEPASVGAAPVAVHMVWIVAHTTVRASKGDLPIPTSPAAKNKRTALSLARPAHA
jgi:hypothetical protein